MVAVTEVSFSVILRKTIDDADRLADDLYDPKIYENNVVTMCHYTSGREPNHFTVKREPKKCVLQ